MNPRLSAGYRVAPAMTRLTAKPIVDFIVHDHCSNDESKEDDRMSSSDTSYITTLHRELSKTLNIAPIAKKPGASTDGKPRADSKRKLRKTWRTLISRGNAALLLRYTLRAFVLCCALYALYTLGLYLLFRDRLFYSLFIARSLML